MDESGELGMNYDAGSSEFLVMGAAIFPNWLPTLAADYFAHAHVLDAKHTASFPKFQRCNDRRKWMLTALAQFYAIRTVHVAIHKPTLAGSHIGTNMHDCYAYLIKLTLERISWWVRDQSHPLDPGNGRCCLVFSQNAALPYQSIRDYIARLQARRGRYNCRIDWRFLDPNFAIVPHASETHLHIADIAAGALYHAVDPTKKTFGITDDRFIRNLRHNICRNRQQVYGLKIFPSTAIQGLRERQLLDFLEVIK